MSTNLNPTPDPNPQPKKRKRKKGAFADLLRDWEGLLGAVTDHGEDLARVEPHRAALADTLDRLKQTKTLQDAHRATRQRNTQMLKAMLLEAGDRAARLRGAVKAELGTANEQLVQFGIPPVRRRVTRSQQSAAAAPQPAAPELQTTAADRGVK